MQSPSGQNRISQLIRQERKSDPDIDNNSAILHLASSCESIDLNPTSIRLFRLDSDESTSVDSSSNPASPVLPFTHKPYSIAILHSPPSKPSMPHFRYNLSTLDRKRKLDTASNSTSSEDEPERNTHLKNNLSLSRSISPSYFSPRSLSPMGECRSAPQSPLLRSHTWEQPANSNTLRRLSTTGGKLTHESDTSSLPIYHSAESLIQPAKFNPQFLNSNTQATGKESSSISSQQSMSFIFPEKGSDAIRSSEKLSRSANLLNFPENNNSPKITLQPQNFYRTRRPLKNKRCEIRSEQIPESSSSLQITSSKKIKLS